MNAHLKHALPAAQTGVVLEVKRTLDVMLSNGELRAGVPSTMLKPLLRFQPDQHILHAGFLGRIDDVRSAPPTNAFSVHDETCQIEA